MPWSAGSRRNDAETRLSSSLDWVGKRAFGAPLGRAALRELEPAAKVDLQPGDWTTTSFPSWPILGAGTYSRGDIATALHYKDNPASLIEHVKSWSGSNEIATKQLTLLFFLYSPPHHGVFMMSEQLREARRINFHVTGLFGFHSDRSTRADPDCAEP